MDVLDMLGFPTRKTKRGDQMQVFEFGQAVATDPVKRVFNHAMRSGNPARRDEAMRAVGMKTSPMDHGPARRVGNGKPHGGRVPTHPSRLKAIKR